MIANSPIGAPLRDLKAGLLSLLLAAAPPSGAAAVEIHGGHSGAWFDPEHSGEGVILEVLDDGLAAVYWYTYDSGGNQLWLFGVGQRVERDGIELLEFPELRRASGARFGDGFDPADVEFEVFAQAEIQFDSCHSAEFRFVTDDATGTLPLTRLTRTAGVSCDPPHGRPGDVVEPWVGESGSWFDQAHVGEGLSIQWTAEGIATITWYTYDPNGAPLWLTGSGVRDAADRIVIDEVVSTRGGGFGGAFDPAEVERIPWGSLTIEMGCDAALLEYASDVEGFGSGTQNLVRLTRLAGSGCPWSAPSPSDLFAFEFSLLPVPPGEFGLDKSQVSSEGVVSGTRYLEDIRFREAVVYDPESGSWEAVGNTLLRPGSFFASAEGGRFVANERHEVGPGVPDVVIEWTPSEQAWSPVEDFTFASSYVDGASTDLDHLVGIGRELPDDPTRPWIWSRGLGQRALSIEYPLPVTLIPSDVASDGSRAVGFAARLVGETASEYEPFAVRWAGDGPPQSLYDADGNELSGGGPCSDDCRTVFGISRTIYAPFDATSVQPWFWVEGGASGYLGDLFDSEPPYAPTSYSLVGTDGAGSLVAGAQDRPTVTGALVRSSWFWTAYTGMVDIEAELVQAGLVGEGAWQQSRARAISHNGKFILLEVRLANGEVRPALVTLPPSSEGSHPAKRAGSTTEPTRPTLPSLTPTPPPPSGIVGDRMSPSKRPGMGSQRSRKEAAGWG